MCPAIQLSCWAPRGADTVYAPVGVAEVWELPTCMVLGIKVAM